MKLKFFLLKLMLLSSFFVQGQNDIVISIIGPQEVYEGARIVVYFSSLKYSDNIEYSSSDLPSFGTLVNDGRGDGRFIFDPTTTDIGKYTVTLHAEEGDLTSSQQFILEVLAIPEGANVYYVDPVMGSDTNSGSSSAPLATLESALSADQVQLTDNTFFFLRTGYHGNLVLQGTFNEPVHILAEAGHTPFVKRLNFFFSINWYLSGLIVTPESSGQVDNTVLINVSAGAREIVITNCKIYTIEDASVWTTNEDWYTYCADGINSSGKDCVYKNNFLKNTWFTVALKQEKTDFVYNIIDWFGGDAIRALDDDQKVNYNQIKNATVFDYNHPTRPQHDDGIQSWTFSNPVERMEIIGNQIADIADPNLPLPTEIMQGIVDFDGFATDWVIENNLVITHHAHGIALYGAINCKVINNTVVKNPYQLYTPNFKPWVRISPRKEEVGGDPSTGNLVRNNIAASYEEDDRDPGTADHNVLSGNYVALFADYFAWNFNLSNNSEALDVGYEEDAPLVDMYKRRRNISAIDAGCFEKGARLIDLEAPSVPSNIQLQSITKTSMTLNWNAANDNTNVAYYLVKVDDQEIKSASTEVFIASLEPNTEYEISIVAIDDFGNQSGEVLYTATTDALEMLSLYYVSADVNDQQLKSNNKLMWVGMPIHRVGGYYGEYDASVILPFQFPCLDGREIVDADLIVQPKGVIGFPNVGIDVYGIGYGNNNSFVPNMHWQGAFGEDPNATAIAESYITFVTNQTEPTSLEQSEKEILGAYLQELFDGLADCNDYVFLRLNIGADQIADNSYYSFASAESTNSFDRPLLRVLTTGTSRANVMNIENGLSAYPNPGLGQVIHLKIERFDEAKADVLVHDMQGREVFRKRCNLRDANGELSLDIDLEKGTYFISLLGVQQYAVMKYVVQ